jgi:hypothetical protein
MPITPVFDAASYKLDTASVVSWTHTQGALTSGIAIITAHDGAAPTFSAATYNGQPATLIVDFGINYARCAMFVYIIGNRPAGTVTVTGTSSSGNTSWDCRTYNYVNQSSPYGTYGSTAVDDVKTVTTNVTAYAGGLVIDTYSCRDLSCTPDGAQTQDATNRHDADTAYFGGSNKPGAAGTVGMTWNQAANWSQMRHIVLPLRGMESGGNPVAITPYLMF